MLKGNPYFIPPVGGTRDLRQKTEALAALTFEQRTANLIALYEHSADSNKKDMLWREINQRLGQVQRPDHP